MLEKIFPLIFVLLVSLNVSYAAVGGQTASIGIGTFCSTASFCGGDYENVCSRTVDDICPQDYGDWSGCNDNIYEGVKCLPCDPDCGQCGALDISLSPSFPSPGQQFEILTNVTNPSKINYQLIYYNSEQRAFAGIVCTDSFCELSVPVDAPNEGGQSFTYSVELGQINGQEYTSFEYVTITGATTPVLIINNPIQNSEQSGAVEISINAESNLLPYEFAPENIQFVKYYLYKYSESHQDYVPVNADTCTMNCQAENCNLINEYTDYSIPRNENEEVTYNWDSTTCDNRDYKLEIKISDVLNSVSDEVLFSLNNPNPPCVDDCSIFSSNLFKTILARIKVWL